MVPSSFPLLEKSLRARAAADRDIITFPLPVVCHLTRPAVAIHVDGIQGLVESRRVSILKRRREKVETGDPVALLGRFPLPVLGGLLPDCVLDVGDLVRLVGPAAGDGAPVVEAEAGIPVARRVVDVSVSKPPGESAAGRGGVEEAPCRQVVGGRGPAFNRVGSAFSWGGRDEEGEGCGDEKRGELHLEGFVVSVLIGYGYR